ncbi:hypothetical protein Zm00014a_005353 [Zea mays]|jgi:hypothetical protein|uniref:Uncharacterized protein n=2 Tax=Zea mays TaxID=4577 RepID=A0A1D6EG51_MAIZE|nr:hypothetical protein ZEAMMB73_Zm00001d004556 [Zea mays]PWZ39306.1 hypothetical protein Zm00014a_005353 [Zea mays]
MGKMKRAQGTARQGDGRRARTGGRAREVGAAAMEEPRRRELGATLGARVRNFDGDRTEERAQGDKGEREARLRAMRRGSYGAGDGLGTAAMATGRGTPSREFRPAGRTPGRGGAELKDGGDEIRARRGGSREHDGAWRRSQRVRAQGEATALDEKRSMAGESHGDGRAEQGAAMEGRGAPAGLAAPVSRARRWSTRGQGIRPEIAHKREETGGK